MKILTQTKLTNYKWLNLFCAEYLSRNGSSHQWLFVSRKEDPSKIKKPDAVVIVPFIGKDNIVLIRQFRVPVGEYIYELPAGIIDDGEDLLTAASREMEEETGLKIVRAITSQDPTKGFYNSAGLSDESVNFVFAEVEGVPSTRHNEGTEDIEVLILNRDQVRMTLNEKLNFSAKCWLICSAFSAGFNWIGE